MEKITRHPLYQTADALKRALVLNGFRLYDDSNTPELISTDQSMTLCPLPKEYARKEILLDDGSYMLRTNLLPRHLPELRGPMPLKVFLCGTVYDGKEKDFPSCQCVEGIFAEKELTKKDCETLWNQIAMEIYGIGSKASLEIISKNIYRIIMHPYNSSPYVLGYTALAGWRAGALLSIPEDSADIWIFSLDMDYAAIQTFGLKDRSELYSNLIRNRLKYPCNSASYGNNFQNKASTILREMGYMEYIGLKILEEDAYTKTHMFEDDWDENNKGIPLVTPLGKGTGIPTVLTAGLERALADNYEDGQETVRIFEIAHIFLPGKKGKKPREKLALSIGSYGPDLTPKEFKKEMDYFLSELGISNHFLIPTNIPISYDRSNCWLVMDEHPVYMEGNLGGISEIAEANHGIGIHANMAHFELAPLEQKAEEEYHFTPSELKE